MDNMDWQLDWRIILPIAIGVGLSAFWYFWPRRKFKMPPIIFGNPDPRDNGPQRWWHIPIWIEKPQSRFIAFFTKDEIAEVHADVVLKEWHRDTFIMRWESDVINGDDAVTLRYHPQRQTSLIRMIPVAIRRTKAGLAFRGIELAQGETYITDRRFIHNAVKIPEILLADGKEYALELRLWSQVCPKWLPVKIYSLIVPKPDENNSKFLLRPI